MKTSNLAEAIVLTALALGSIVEGVRVIAARDPHNLTDVLGPGAYIIGLGVLLLVTTVVYVGGVVGAGRKRAIAAPAPDDEALPVAKVLLSIAALGVSAMLIDPLGYFIPTFLLLIAQSRLFGLVPAWKNIVAAAVIATALYVIFIKFAAIPFPRGTLWP